VNAISLRFQALVRTRLLVQPRFGLAPDA